MSGAADVEAVARGIVDRASYMTLATADADGRPWASPVWFAHDGYRELFWVSAPGAWHSLNISVRPEVSIVIFDSGVAPAEAAGVYLNCSALQVTDDAALAHAMAVYSRRSVDQGLSAWSVDDVSAPEDRRLYRAEASRAWLGRADERIPLGAP
jgi:general stress protein 26